MKKEASNYLYYFNNLKQSPIFSEVKDDVLHEILEMFHSKKYLKDDYPLTSDSTMYNIYVIITGRVEKNNKNNKNIFNKLSSTFEGSNFFTELGC